MPNHPHPDTKTAIARCPLFHGIPESTLASMLSPETAALRQFSAGEEIPLTKGDTRALVLLTEGIAFAYSTDEKRSVILRSIEPGTVFGVSVLFSDEAPVSVVRAKTAVSALCWDADTVAVFLRENEVFRMNYIAFLSGRIRFLNRRIACYTAGSAERKLALYLAELPRDAESTVYLDISMTALCELLDVGRASLYRAFSKLSEQALIARDDRRVRILDHSALLSYGAEP